MLRGMAVSHSTSILARVTMTEPITWREGGVVFLDQTRLPQDVVTVETDDPAVLIGAIQVLAIRGAPLIGIAGAYAAVLSAKRHVGKPWDLVLRQWEAIAQARPTAVNLAWAIARMRQAVRAEGLVTRADADLLEATALAVHNEDRMACERIAEFGQPLIAPRSGILTHCNTGSLATGGIGTALGIIRRAWEGGRCQHVYVDETRPLLQGARLTSWELMQLGIPFTVISDSTAAVLMRQQKVQAVVVGADRIARNGDVANKVGTYGLAVLAKAHRIPFIVAAPGSTIDPQTPDGASIPIEERQPEEVLTIAGTATAAAGAKAYNPAFDVTPYELVTAIVTDRGVLKAPFQGASGAQPGTGSGV